MERITTRQAFIIFSLYSPLIKLLFFPVLASYELQNNAYLLAIIYGVYDLILLATLIYTEKKYHLTVYEIIEKGLPPVFSKIVYALLAAYFLMKSFPIFCEQSILLTSSVYESAPTAIVYLPVLVLMAYAAFKGVASLARTFEFLFPFMLMAIVGLCALTITAVDLTEILPLSTLRVMPLIRSVTNNGVWGFDSIIYIVMMGRVGGKENGRIKNESGKEEKVKVPSSPYKLLFALAIGWAVVTLLMMLVTGIFGTITIRQILVLTKISKYSIAFSNLGRLDFVFIIVLYLGMILYTAINVLIACSFVTKITKSTRLYFVIAFTVAVYLLVANFSLYFEKMYLFFSIYIMPVINLLSYNIPTFLLFVARRVKKKDNEKRSGRGNLFEGNGAKIEVDAQSALINSETEKLFSKKEKESGV